MRMLRTFPLALGLGALLAACAPVATPPVASDAPRPGGTITLAWQQPETLHPFYSTGTQTNAVVYRVAVEGLVGVAPDGTPRAVLATQIPTTANGAVNLDPAGGMSVRWTLRPGVRWSDGVPLVSADVRFTWRAVMTDPRVASREGYDRIADVDTPDDLTAIVRYRTIDVAFATRFDALLPRHLLDGADAAALTAYSRAPLGTGPFRITEFVSADHVTAERNPNYRVAGRPYVDRIFFRFVPSVDAAKAQLRAGEVDAALSLSEADAAELEREPGIRVASATSPSVETLAFDLARPGDPSAPHPVLGDVVVRRALLLATPKDRIVQRPLLVRTRPGTSELPIGWAAPGGLTQETYDPERAKRLLDGAGWVAGADGIRAKDGVRAAIRVVSTTGNRLREQIEQVLVDEWRAVGVDLSIRNVPNATLTGSGQSGRVRKKGDFDVLLAQTGLGPGSTDPQG